MMLDLDARAAGLLVVSETAYPGWTATVDGAPAPVLSVDGVVMGVEVPAGAKQVVLEYRPGVLAAGAILSVAAALGCVLWIVINRRR